MAEALVLSAWQPAKQGLWLFGGACLSGSAQAHPKALSRLPSCAVRDLSAYLAVNSFFTVSRYA